MVLLVAVVLVQLVEAHQELQAHLVLVALV